MHLQNITLCLYTQVSISRDVYAYIDMTAILAGIGCSFVGCWRMSEKKKRPYTEAQARAQKKYLESLGEIRVRTTKEKKALIQDAAAAAGESMNEYALNAIEQRMQRENDSPA